MQVISVSSKHITKSKAITIKALLLCLLIPVFSAVLPMLKAAEVWAVDELPGNDSGVAGGAFEVTEYKFDAVVNKDHSYEVEENISVKIPDQLKSISFSIPSGNFRITGLEAVDTSFSASTGSDSSTVTITDQEKLSEGSHTYTIKYTIREFADRDGSSDMFYFNVLPPEWRQPIGNLEINVAFPDDFQWNDLQCYAGQFGVQDVTNRITFIPDEASHSARITGSLIPENFGITLKAQLTDGYWEGALDGIWAVYLMIIMMAVILLALFILWIKGGRDPKVKKEKVTKPIEGVAPHELGYVFNSELTIRDIVMLIFELAIKGYLRISEYEPKKYRLYRLKDPSSEAKHIRNAYNILLGDVYQGRAIEMNEMGKKLEDVISEIHEDIAAGFSDNERIPYTPLSKAFRIAGTTIVSIGLGIAAAVRYLYAYLPVNYLECIAVGALSAAVMYMMCKTIDDRDSAVHRTNRLGEAAGVISFMLITGYVTIGIIRDTGQIFAAALVPVFAALSAFLVVIMRARGLENTKLVTGFRQLRNFIYHPTPKEILDNYLQDQDYYYDMLLYALAFGAEESWAISFLTLDVPEPDWYSDDIEGQAFSNLKEELTTIDYSRSLRSFMRTIENAYSDMHRYSRRSGSIR